MNVAGVKEVNGRERAMGRLLATGAYTVDELADFWKCSLRDAQLFVEKSSREYHMLVVLDPRGKAWVPAFQFDKRKCLKVEIALILAPMLEAQVPPWKIWAWLASPTQLDGIAPLKAFENIDLLEDAYSAAQEMARKHTTIRRRARQAVAV